MQNQFQVDVRSEGRAAVIAISGELDLASSPALEEQLARVSQSDAELLVMDLRQLDFMDSTGLSILVKAHQQATKAGQEFGVVRGSEQVQRLLNLTGVAERLVLVDTPEQLLQTQ
ncbi:MAG: STAS domain-containing protein [Solirubrobacterales bacterium]|nr:STAS domain-containing protein [Solirubrobacterales bacterium]